MNLMVILNKAKRAVFGANTRYQVGSTVQTINGDGDFMVVIEIATEIGLKTPFIHCMWFDTKANATRCRLFRECELKHVDLQANDINGASLRLYSLQRYC